MLKNLLIPTQEQMKTARVTGQINGGYIVKIGKSMVRIQTKEDLQKGDIVLVAKIDGNYNVLTKKGQTTEKIKRVYVEK